MNDSNEAIAERLANNYQSEVRIYVACLASYNNGVLYGAWLDATQDAAEIQNEVDAMLRGSKFPNVTRICPECNNVPDTNGEVCSECHGRGEVPSAEEWSIHDYEGFEGIKLSEYESFEKVSKLAELIEDHGEAFAIFYNNDNDNTDVDNLEDTFQEAYQGVHRTLEDYAAEFVEECYSDALKDLPAFLRYHIDWQGVARDFELGGDIWSEQGSEGVHVFNNNV